MYCIRSVFYCVLALALWASCNTQQPNETTYWAPAEFEAQESIWMAWPVYDNKQGLSTKALHVQLWAAIAPHAYIDVVLNPTDSSRHTSYELQQREIDSLVQRYQVPKEKLRFHTLAHEDLWWRDMGPVFLRNAQGQRAVANFGFNAWGYEPANSPYSQREGRIDSLVAQSLKLPVFTSQLISEGGNRELNGRGTLIVVESVERHRNPGWTRAQMEAEYKRLLGVKKTIWIPWGRFDDDHSFRQLLPGPDRRPTAYTVITTGGHIDEHLRFASHNTLLYTHIDSAEAAADPIAAENKRRMDANLRILQQATDQDGQPFRLVPMPSAPCLYDTLRPGDGVYDYLAANDSMRRYLPLPAGQPIQVVLAASYLNFLIVNGLVLGQKYYQPGAPAHWRTLDSLAQHTLQTTFPKHQVVLVDARAINIGGGGIHCNTQQMPASHPIPR